MPPQDSRSRIVSAYFAYFSCLSILVSLGIWQVARGLHKAEIEDLSGLSAGQVLQNRDMPEDLSSLDYVRVVLRGTMDHAHAFYLDNRVYRGRVGYEVFVPFTVDQADFSLLVNRGWVAKDRSGQVAEMAIQPSRIREISGHLYHPETGFALGPAFTEPDRWPVTVQYLDFPAQSELLGVDLRPVVLVLDEDAPDALQRIWQPYVMDAARHYGYAAQWWGLALVLVVFGLIWRRIARQQEGEFG